ncbi:restriction endonuclease subunit S [Hyphomonadaceae bacterium BL14]|nr:restriction endonuclease subunit S [Hyphomonadaceae bacterium BL14]
MASERWSLKSIDELGTVARGRSRHRPRNDPRLYGGAYPFFQTGDVKAAELHLRRHTQTYNEAGLAQSKLWEPGPLLITIAANIAETAILGVKGCFPDSIVAFNAYPDQADNKYVKYMLDTLKGSMAAVSQGATQGNLSLEKLRSFKFSVPPVGTQRRIAAILSAYDDLIEINTRRIAILEEMARRVYEEWFVHNRRPDWPEARADEVVSFNPRTPVPKEGVKLFVPMAALSETSMVIDGVETKAGNAGAKFQNGDTLFARITPCLENGKTGLVDFLPDEQPTACGSTEFIVMREAVYSREMVYLLARSDPFRSAARQSMSGATGRQRVHLAALEEFPVCRPDDATIQRFTAMTRPMFELAGVLSCQNANLRTQRDLLLPRLVSGKLSVDDAERQVEETAA